MIASLAASWQLFVTSLVGILVIVDPFALVPIFLVITERDKPEHKIHICRKATILSFVILTAFAVTGMGIFNLFGITIPAFKIAGGVLLLLLGIDQLRAERSRVREDEQTIAIVMLIAYATLRSSPYLFRVLGKTGLNLVTRLMGVILTAIAVQLNAVVSI